MHGANPCVWIWKRGWYLWLLSVWSMTTASNITVTESLHHKGSKTGLYRKSGDPIIFPEDLALLLVPRKDTSKLYRELPHHKATTVMEYACFNNVLDLHCPNDHVLVLESARYGRNDTTLAAACNTPFKRNCDIDVHFIMNRLCSGRAACALVVSSDLFRDPCGYEEFLKVVYSCVQVTSLHRDCAGPASSTAALFDHGHVASPNYPEKYYMDAECSWQLRVQTRQTIQVSIVDFELAVKSGGQCFDFLEITSGEGQSIFKDCGAMGKTTLQIDTDSAHVRFKAGQALTERGFLLYFEAVGPGCPDLDLAGNGTVTYSLTDDVLSAEVTCAEGFAFPGTDVIKQHLLCEGSLWNDTLEPCVASIIPMPSPFFTTEPPATTSLHASQAGDLVRSGTIVGIALGVVSALLLIALLLVLALYLQRRRKRAEQKLDEMRVVFNNLQENALNDGHLSVLSGIYCKAPPPPASNLRRPDRRKRHNQICAEDRNLLAPAPYMDESDYDMEKDTNTYVKCLGEDDYGYGRCGGKGRSRNREGFLRNGNASRENMLDYSTDSDGPYGHHPPVPPRRLRHQRACSGQWDSPGRMTSPPSVDKMAPSVNKNYGLLTQSAPDLLALLASKPTILPMPQTLSKPSNAARKRMSRSSTLASVHGHRTLAKMRSRSGSRANVRA